MEGQFYSPWLGERNKKFFWGLFAFDRLKWITSAYFQMQRKLFPTNIGIYWIVCKLLAALAWIFQLVFYLPEDNKLPGNNICWRPPLKSSLNTGLLDLSHNCQQCCTHNSLQFLIMQSAFFHSYFIGIFVEHRFLRLTKLTAVLNMKSRGFEKN